MRVAHPQFRPRLLRLAVACALAFAGCAGPKVRVPPRVDLRGWTGIGLITVHSTGPSNVEVRATQELMQAIHASQPGVALLELGEQRRVLSKVGSHDLDPDAVRAIGARYGVDAILVAHLELTEAKPKLRVSTSLDALSAEARIRGAFDARLLRTSNGATVWTTGSHGSRSIAHLRAQRRSPVAFGAGDAEQAYVELVRSLVYEATHELRPTWQRR